MPPKSRSVRRELRVIHIFYFINQLPAKTKFDVRFLTITRNVKVSFTERPYLVSVRIYFLVYTRIIKTTKLCLLKLSKSFLIPLLAGGRIRCGIGLLPSVYFEYHISSVVIILTNIEFKSNIPIKLKLLLLHLS